MVRSIWLVRLFCAALIALAPPAIAQQSFRDDAGRAVVLSAAIATVWPAGPPAAVLIDVLAPRKLMGWIHAPDPAALAFLPQADAALPALGRITGRSPTVDAAVLRRAAPDLILDVGTIDPGYVALADRMAAQTEIPYALMDGRLADSPATLRRVGRMLGVAGRAETLARYAEAVLGRVKRRIAAIPAAQRPTIYMTRGPRGLQAAVAGSINAEIVDLLGARNIVAASSSGNFAALSLDRLRVLQPDVIVTIDPDFYAAALHDPAWQTLAAVAAHRLYLAPGAPFGWVDEPPSVNRLIGLLWLAQKLYPAQFPEDMRSEAARFYKLFYQRTPSGAQLDALLGAQS
ncbi:MAG TPA: ABC transporter substrate-binding protein [Stellaceae bacterium]|nr:ABC transporter substrate-binding protein [Stellaceae bacterium]